MSRIHHHQPHTGDQHPRRVRDGRRASGSTKQAASAVDEGPGVLVLTGTSCGDRKIEVPGDRILLGFVLGNKVAVGSVNANRVYFERGVQDMALAVAQYPGWLKRLRFILHPSSFILQRGSHDS